MLGRNKRILFPSGTVTNPQPGRGGGGVNHSDYMDLFHTHACVKAENNTQRHAHIKKHTLVEILNHALVLYKAHIQSAGNIFHTKSCKVLYGTFVCEVQKMSDRVMDLNFLIFTIRLVAY